MKLTVDEHEILGHNLQGIREYTLSVWTRLCNVYGVNSRESRRGKRALVAMDLLRSVLDDRVARELPMNINTPAIYYRNQTGKSVLRINDAHTVVESASR